MPAPAPKVAHDIDNDRNASHPMMNGPENAAAGAHHPTAQSQTGEPPQLSSPAPATGGASAQVAKARQSATPIDRQLFGRCLRSANRVFMHCYHQVTVRTPHHLPRSGPAILVCNHTSSLDPMIIQAASSRLIVWMMAKEYYAYRALAPIFHGVGVIPVDRGGRDTSSTRAALRMLREGQVLGIFPEGRLAPTRELLPFQTGVALLALRTGAAVYPTFLDGSQRGQEMVAACAEPNEASLWFGPPVVLPHRSTDRAVLDEATQRIRDAVDGLRLTAERQAQRPR